MFEVGAGIGCTVKVFQRAGCRASGIEPNDGFQLYSRERLRADVKSGYLFNLPPLAQHDLVLLVHVIEHFRSPREAMHHLHQLIRPNGFLYVECPNLGAPFATRSRLFHYAHIHNFTPATLQMMAAATGFEVVQWFTDWNSPNLEVLLRKTESAELTLDMSSYDDTIAALKRFNWLTYHARWSYCEKRLSQLGMYLREHSSADRFVAGLLEEIGNETPELSVAKRAA